MGDEPHDAPTLIGARSQQTDPDATLPSEGSDVVRRQRLQRGDLLGRYVVLDSLGEGGMGVVHLAFDPELERRVAIKLVKAEPGGRARDSSGHSRLLREAQALAKLTHPNVVGVYDVGAWNEAVFVAMEYVDGETLSSWIRRRHASGEPPWREVLSILRAEGRGLEAAHACGIVHRDFKPENVMIAEDGRVLVLGFGLARADDVGEPAATAAERAGSASPTELRLTATGSVMGTPSYMSPEQYMAAPTDAASDQFSFCVTLYHALYGERPFVGETLFELTAAVVGGRVLEPPQNTRVPAWLRRVVLRGLAVDPQLRHPSMSELLSLLQRDPERRRTRVLLGVGALAVLGAGLAWGRAPDRRGRGPLRGGDGGRGDDQRLGPSAARGPRGGLSARGPGARRGVDRAGDRVARRLRGDLGRAAPRRVPGRAAGGHRGQPRRRAAGGLPRPAAAAGRRHGAPAR